MTKTRLSNKQREVLIEWVNDRNDSFTIAEVQDIYEVHYMTAHSWVRTLENEGLIELVEKAGKTHHYRAAPPVGGFDQETMNARALRVTFGPSKKELSIAEWASGHCENNPVPAATAGMLYLFVRSYYYDAPDHQHLRGVATPLEVRGAMDKILRAMEAEANVVRQLLALRAPWIEGPSMALRFGNPVAGFEMTEAVNMAQGFQRDVLGYKEAPAIEVEEDSP